jgi:hypothetical protein
MSSAEVDKKNLIEQRSVSMTDIPPRCPFCASVLKIEPTFWEHLGFKPPAIRCPACQQDFDRCDAHTMGTQYWNWAEHFRKRFNEALQTTAILSEPAAMKALGSPHSDETRLISSLEELVRICLRHHRHALVEMARGREATLEVVPLWNQGATAVEAIASVSKTSLESGAKQHEQIVARTGMTHYVLFTYAGADGVEPRVQNALHRQAHSGGSAGHAGGTIAHATANMQSRHGEVHDQLTR